MREGKAYALIDIETGGLDINKHALLEIAVVFITEKGEVLETYETLVRDNLDWEITEQALKLTKIDLREVKEKGKTKEEIIKDIKAIKKRHNILTLAPMGWVVNFDLAFLRRYLGEAFYYLFNDYHAIDLFSIVYFLYGYVHLEEAARKLLNKEIQQEHRVLSDALLTLEVYRTIIRRR